MDLSAIILAENLLLEVNQMSATALAICGLIMWSVLLSFVLVFVRTGSVLRGEKALNEFQPDGKDLADAGLRVTRAHANSLEYLALPLGILLLALATNNTTITNGLALTLLGCRILQSVVHMISTSPPMVMTRASLFTVQLVIMIIWAAKLSGIT